MLRMFNETRCWYQSGFRTKNLLTVLRMASSPSEYPAAANFGLICLANALGVRRGFGLPPGVRLGSALTISSAIDRHFARQSSVPLRGFRPPLLAREVARSASASRTLSAT